MKRLKIMTCVMTAGILLFGCVDNNIDKELEKVTEDNVKVTSAVVTTKEQETTAEQTVSEEMLRVLIDKNINCNLNIFSGSLPLALADEGKDVEIDMQNNTLYQVSEKAFPDYASFEEYIRSVYCKETADMYLYNYPYEGVQKYKNVDGKLYIDLKYDGGKGYYVIWDDYKITIDSSSADKCEFTV